MTRRSLLIAALGVLAFAFTAIAQTPTPPPDDDVIRVESRLIVVPVSVTGKNGEPITGLKADDFRLAEEGRQQVIDGVGTAAEVPLEIALLFDISATTNPMFKFQQETAAKFLQDVLKPNDRATIFTIGAKPKLVQPRSDAAKSVTAIHSIEGTKQFTAFFDTVRAAAEYLQRNAPDGTRRVILVISDGEDTNSASIAKAIQDGYRRAGQSVNTLDNKKLYQLTVANRDKASKAERQRVVRAIQDADTVFYSINPAGSSYQLNKMSQYGQENMQTFASDTGGTAFLPKFAPIDTKDQYQNTINMRTNTEALDRIFRQLGNELHSQYLIRYYSDSEYPLNKFVKLAVGLKNRGDLSIRARQGYFVK